MICNHYRAESPRRPASSIRMAYMPAPIATEQPLKKYSTTLVCCFTGLYLFPGGVPARREPSLWNNTPRGSKEIYAVFIVTNDGPFKDIDEPNKPGPSYVHTSRFKTFARIARHDKISRWKACCDHSAAGSEDHMNRLPSFPFYTHTSKRTRVSLTRSRHRNALWVLVLQEALTALGRLEGITPPGRTYSKRRMVTMATQPYHARKPPSKLFNAMYTRRKKHPPPRELNVDANSNVVCISCARQTPPILWLSAPQLLTLAAHSAYSRQTGGITID